MDDFDNLNDDNYILFAAKNYCSPICIQSEFNDDIKKIKYIKRLFRKYKTKKDLKERLILNHIILFYNVFGVEAATRILFLKIDKKDYDLLKTCLIYLHYMPDKVFGIDGYDIINTDIPINMELADALRKI